MKMRLKMKNRSHGCDIKRPWPKHEHKSIKYNMSLSVTMVICIKLTLALS